MKRKWNLTPLTRRDATANDLLEFLDLDTAPAFLAAPVLPADTTERRRQLLTSPGSAGETAAACGGHAGRTVVAVDEDGRSVEVTLDLAARRTDAYAPRWVRLISEPPDIMARFVSLMSSGAARQLAAALLNAAGQAEELDRDVTRPSR